MNYATPQPKYGNPQAAGKFAPNRANLAQPPAHLNSLRTGWPAPSWARPAYGPHGRSWTAVLQRCGDVRAAHPVRPEACDDCKKKKKEKELQRDPAGPAESAYAPPIVHQVLNTPGEALGGSTRTFFEQRFGFDFSGVRVHSDARAAESARAVNANAYAVGNHLVFAKDRYQPYGSAGRRLLAHELAHTVQQDATSPSGALRIGAPDDAFEHQAETVAHRVAAGPLPAASPANGLARPVQPDQLRRSAL
jgi:hypothetical protein